MSLALDSCDSFESTWCHHFGQRRVRPVMLSPKSPLTSFTLPSLSPCDIISCIPHTHLIFSTKAHGESWLRQLSLLFLRLLIFQLSAFFPYRTPCFQTTPPMADRVFEAPCSISTYRLPFMHPLLDFACLPITLSSKFILNTSPGQRQWRFAYSLLLPIYSFISCTDIFRCLLSLPLLQHDTIRWPTPMVVRVSSNPCESFFHTRAP